MAIKHGITKDYTINNKETENFGGKMIKSKTFAYSGEFYKRLFRLMIPATIGNVLTYSVGFVDHVLTGRMAPAAGSGVYISNQIVMLLYFLTVGIEGTISALGARKEGYKENKFAKVQKEKDNSGFTERNGEDERHNFEKTDNILALSLVVGLFMSFLLTLVCTLLPKTAIWIFTKNIEIINTGAPFLRIIGFSFPFYVASRIFVAYQRAHGRAAPSLMTPLLSFLVNLSLGLCLPIFFPDRIEVIAVGTLTSRIFEFLFMLIYTIIYKRRDSGDVASLFVPKKDGIKEYFGYLLPMLSGQVVWSVSTFFITAVMSHIDGGGVVLPLGVANSLYNLLYTLMNGTSISVGTIISHERGILDRSLNKNGAQEKGKTIPPIGKDNSTRKTPREIIRVGTAAVRNLFSAFVRIFSKNQRKTAPISRFLAFSRLAELTFILVGALSFILFIILCEPFLRLYKLDAENSQIARSFIYILAIILFATSYSASTLFGIVKARGDVRFALYTDLLCFLLLTLPLGLIAMFSGAPAWLTLALLKLEHIIKCIPAAIAAGHFYSSIAFLAGLC